jgi:hypothetical protein
MRISTQRIFIVLVMLLVLFFQIVLFISLNTYLNALTAPYRYEERRKAFKDWADEKTPESRAVFDQEVKLLDVHLKNKAIFQVAVFLVIDGIGIYCFWNYGAKRRQLPNASPDSK